MAFDGSLILGGVAKPNFHRIEQNYVTNQYFDVDTTGWQVSSAGILTRPVSEHAYGEFMGRINYTSDFEYAYWEESLSSGPQNRRFLGAVRVVAASTQTFKIEIVNQDGNTVVAATFQATTDPQTFFIEGESEDADILSSYSVTLRIYGTAITGNADIYFDNVFFSEVLSKIELPLPLSGSGEQQYLVFQKENDGANELWNGNRQEFGKKWRPSYFGKWDYISQSNELLRQNIAESDLIFCQPHSDVAWGFLGLWTRDFERRYSFGRFMGHRGDVMIDGSEYVKGPIPSLENPTYPVSNPYAIFPLSDAKDYGQNLFAITTNGTVNFVSGKIDNCAQTAAAGDLQHVDNSAFNFDGESFTFSVWFNFSNISTHRIVFSKYNSTGNQRQYRLYYYNTANAVRWEVYRNGGSATQFMTPISSPSTGIWYHLVCGYDASMPEIFYYLNGGAKQSSSVIDRMETGTATFRIMSADDGLRMHGSVDELGCWNRVLTDDEVATLWNGGNGVSLL